MRIKEEDERVHATQNHGHTDEKWKGIPGSNIPEMKMGKPNSKATEIKTTLSLFADDTTIVGQGRELEEGAQIVKHVMEKLEERNNGAKEGRALIWTSGANEIRMLGCWLWRKNRIESWI